MAGEDMPGGWKTLSNVLAVIVLVAVAIVVVAGAAVAVAYALHLIRGM